MKPSHFLSPAFLLGLLTFSSCMDFDFNGMFASLPSLYTGVIYPELPRISIDSITSHGDSATVWMRLDGDSTMVLYDIGLNGDAGPGPEPVIAMELVRDTLELSPVQPYKRAVIIRELDVNTTYALCPKARYLEFGDTVSVVSGCISFKPDP